MNALSKIFIPKINSAENNVIIGKFENGIFFV